MRALLTTLPLLLSVTGDAPFRPESNSSWKHTFTASHDLTHEGFIQSLNGGDPVELPGGARFTSRQRYQFEDVCGDVDPATGIPSSLRRRYLALETSGELAPPEIEEVVRATATSRLAGASVLFTWVPEERDHGRFYDAREEDEELLPALTCDPFLSSFERPSGASEDSWEIPASALQPLLAPGGSLGFAPGEERMGRRLSRTLVNGVGGGLEVAFGGEATGQLRVSVGQPWTDEDGKSWETLSLSLDGRWKSTVTERLNSTILPREQEQGSAFEHGSIGLDLSGNGRILIDPVTGRPASLQLTCSESVTMRIVELLEDGGRFEQKVSMRGRVTFEHRRN